MKKLTAVILALIMTFGCFSMISFADEGVSGQLKIANYNVDGLPIPPQFSSTNKDTVATTKEIAKQLNAMSLDIVGVQEDFEFHPMLKKGLAMTDATYSNGGTGTGSGCNIFSSRKIYNSGRESWNEAYGIFDAGSDELTPKGVVYSTIDLGNGAYVDIYDCHIDAFDDEGSTKAKRSQYEQLQSLIEKHSGKNHAVIVMGDMNAYFNMESGIYMRELLVDQSGFKEAWVETNLAGDYETWKYDGQYNCGRWGVWDSAEKIFYRSSQAVTLEAESSSYVNLTYEEGKNLSDHSVQLAVINYTVNTEFEKTEDLKPNRLHLFKFLFDFEVQLFKTIGKILGELPDLILGNTKIDYIK